MSHNNHLVSIIGSAGCGKSTFLAVNYFLLQSQDNEFGIYLEPAPTSKFTTRQLIEWEEQLDDGYFPKKSPATAEKMTTLELNLWREFDDDPLGITDFDPGGEIWDVFNPILDDTQLDEDIKYYIKSSKGHLILIDVNEAGKQDNFYRSILANIRELMPEYRRSEHKPVVIVLTKVDKKADINNFDPLTFFEKEMPKTSNFFNRFFARDRNLEDLIYPCSIGAVSEQHDLLHINSESTKHETMKNKKSIRIKSFNPIGFNEPLFYIFDEIELLKE
ncbi:MAG: hypothetical protein DWQ05_06240 [Calditrichaeota bacterium]|nr:MAG: hypothetical protein DWQ05_06240 [Calditrichota bacterium]